MSPPYRPRSRRTSRSSCLATGWSLENARLRLALFFSRLWLFIACRRNSLPPPDTLNRFLAALFVFCLGTCRLHLLSSGFRRAEQHDHVPSVLKRGRLDHSDLLDVLGKSHEEVSTALGMRLLSPPEHDRDLHLRPRVEEADHMALLRLVVVDA